MGKNDHIFPIRTFTKTFNIKTDQSDLDIISKTPPGEECDFKLRNVGFQLNTTVYTLMPQLSKDSTFCADATINANIGTCIGDSGGPAIHK